MEPTPCLDQPRLATRYISSAGLRKQVLLFLVAVYLFKFAVIDPGNAAAARIRVWSCNLAGAFCIVPSDSAKRASTSLIKEAEAIQSFAAQMLGIANRSAVTALGDYAYHLDKMSVNIYLLDLPDRDTVVRLAEDAHQSVWDVQDHVSILELEGPVAALFFIREYMMLADHLKCVQKRPRRHEWMALADALDAMVVRFDRQVVRLSPTMDNAINSSSVAMNIIRNYKAFLTDHIKSTADRHPLSGAYLCGFWASCRHEMWNMEVLEYSRDALGDIFSDIDIGHIEMDLKNIRSGAEILLKNIRDHASSAELGLLPEADTFYEMVIGLEGLEGEIVNIDKRRFERWFK